MSRWGARPTWGLYRTEGLSGTGRGNILVVTSATWPSQVDTDKPVGVHFRGQGHVPQRDTTGQRVILDTASGDPKTSTKVFMPHGFHLVGLGTMSKKNSLILGMASLPPRPPPLPLLIWGCLNLIFALF